MASVLFSFTKGCSSHPLSLSNMICGQKPRPKGSKLRITYSKEKCVKHGTNEAFANMTAEHWCSEKLMAKNFVVLHGLTCNYQDVLKQIKVSLSILLMKQKFLDKYCKSTIDYFKAENVANSFKDTYNKELEELKIQ
ncbi:unnamed protein product [Rhizopus stolonifer]